MPKMKSNRTARKKVFPNKNGKIKRAQAYHSHNTAKKSPKRRRNLGKTALVDKTNAPTLRRMLPYGGK